MKHSLNLLVLAFLAIAIPFILPGCGGSSAPTLTLQPQYGAGPYGAGMNLNDTSTVGLDLSFATDCSAFTGLSESNATGSYTFTPPCNEMQFAIDRSTSTNCSATNAAGGGFSWQYDAAQFYAGGTPYLLPCGSLTVIAAITPGSIPLAYYSTLTMTGSSGDFDVSGGTPIAFYYDSSGNILGSQTVTSTAADGSYVTFISDPIANANYTGTFYVTALNVNGEIVTGNGDTASVLVYDPNNNGGGGGGGGDDGGGDCDGGCTQ